VKIALIGHGKMGKQIEELSASLNIEVVATIGRADRPLTLASLNGAQVAVEFTHPHAAAENLTQLATLQIPTVSGTTGWFENLETVRDLYLKNKTTLIYGANFSIGVALFERITSEAAKLFANAEEYGAYAWEAHHEKKKDAPSGTLIKLVESMQRAGYSRPVNVSSTRAGSIPGTHEIGFDSAADTITLKHTARNREGFARGALFAAKRALEINGVFEFSEVIFHD